MPAFSGRLASSNPNLQNIPVRTEEGKEIRRVFIAQPNYKLLSADYSQIELRLMAEVANVTKLKESFLNGCHVCTHADGIDTVKLRPFPASVGVLLHIRAA